MKKYFAVAVIVMSLVTWHTVSAPEAQLSDPGRALVGRAIQGLQLLAKTSTTADSCLDFLDNHYAMVQAKFPMERIIVDYGWPAEYDSTENPEADFYKPDSTIRLHFTEASQDSRVVLGVSLAHELVHAKHFAARMFNVKETTVHDYETEVLAREVELRIWNQWSGGAVSRAIIDLDRVQTDPEDEPPITLAFQNTVPWATDDEIQAMTTVVQYKLRVLHRVALTPTTAPLRLAKEISLEEVGWNSGTAQ